MHLIFILMCAFGFILYLANRIDNKMKTMEFNLLNRMQQLQRAVRANTSVACGDDVAGDDGDAEGDDDAAGDDGDAEGGDAEGGDAEGGAFLPCRGGRVCD